MVAGVLYKKPGPGWLWWCARRCRVARRNRRGQIGAVGPGVPEHQHRAYVAHAYRNSKPQRRTRIPAGAKPGLAMGRGAGAVISADAVLMPVPVGAGRCWPAGHGAGGGVAQRRRIAVAWASAPGRRLETSVYFRI